ncbi:hypothetical protein [Moorena producens]|uniref:hypothetical protein n=1 Tax=Moorena producens TaxID=1155739 RepID=UPI0011EA627D|nr:hypothetical protein [Moorena producens]
MLILSLCSTAHPTSTYRFICCWWAAGGQCLLGLWLADIISMLHCPPYIYLPIHLLLVGSAYFDYGFVRLSC